MKNDVSKLSYEGCAAYLKITSYLNEKRLNRSEYKRVCEDIYLMISEAESRGEKVDDLFPEGFQKFCDDVAANCTREKWYLTLLGALACALLILAAVTLVNVIAVCLAADEGETVNGVTITVTVGDFVASLVASAIGVAVNVLSARFAFKHKYVNVLGIVCIVIGAIAANLILDAIINAAYITFNWVALACAPAGAAALLYAAKYFLAKKLS